MASHALASNDQSPKLESRTSRSSSWGWPHLVSIQVKVADAGSSSRPSSMYNAEESEPSQELNDRTTPSQISLPLSPIHNDPDSDNSVGEEICPECEENQLSENNRTHFASSSNSLSSLSECGTVRARRSYLEGQLQHASSSENLRGRQSPPNELERPPQLDDEEKSMTDSEMNKLEDDRKEVGPSDIDELDSDRKTIGTSKTSRGDDNQETSSIKGLDDDRKTIGTSEVSRPDNNQKSCRASHNISELDNHQKSIETSEVSGQDDNRTSVGTSSLGELDSNQKSIRFSDTKELEGADAGTPSHQDAVFLEFTEHVPEMEHKSKGSDSSEPYEKITNARRMVIELPYPGNSQKHQIPKIFVETPSETTDANFYLPTPKVSAFTEQSQSERRPQRPASSRASFPSESVSKNPQNPSPPESSVGTVPRPSQVRKRKKYLNKVRNVAVRKTILKITLGRQLAGQTKPALKLLATGEAVTFDLVTRA